MVDAPEKIWISEAGINSATLKKSAEGMTEYTRSYLVAELAAENERLRQEPVAVSDQAKVLIAEASYHIGFIKGMAGDTDEIREIADKALSALKAAMEAGG